jgi:hypothetical protein
MPAMIDAQFVRAAKLAALTGAIGACLAGTLFVLDGTLRMIMAGVVAGLGFPAAAWLIEAYRRRGPVDASRAAVDRKARWARAHWAMAGALASLIGVPVRHFHLEWSLAGFLIGCLFFLGLWVSSIFRAAPIRRATLPATARMTSMERAARTPYK